MVDEADGPGVREPFAGSMDEVSIRDPKSTLLKTLQSSWQMLGEHDPLWAILSAPDKQGGRWDVDEFFETGRREVADLQRYLQELSVSSGRGRALDFGCGVGRVTSALAPLFERVDGIDISAPMVTRARTLHAGIDNLHFHVLPENGIPFEDAAFDLVYSRLVLQHIPTELVIDYVADFVRILRPGGVAVFQAPSKARGREEDIEPSPVELESGTAFIEMHVHPREQIEATVLRSGGRFVDVRIDDCAGEFFDSLRYAVTV